MSIQEQNQSSIAEMPPNMGYDMGYDDDEAQGLGSSSSDNDEAYCHPGDDADLYHNSNDYIDASGNNDYNSDYDDKPYKNKNDYID